MNKEHIEEQGEAAYADFLKVFNEETKDFPRLRDDEGIKDLAYLCWLAGFKRCLNE